MGVAVLLMHNAEFSGQAVCGVPRLAESLVELFSGCCNDTIRHRSLAQGSSTLIDIVSPYCHLTQSIYFKRSHGRPC